MNDPEIIDYILENTRTIAVVGLSVKPDRASYGVARQLQRRGYRIVPVNPNYPQVLGETSYPSLRDIPFAVDLVDVFRASEFVPEIVEDTLAIGCNYLWLQEGIVHPQAIARAEAGGIHVVADRCMFKEYLRWSADRRAQGAPPVALP